MMLNLKPYDGALGSNLQCLRSRSLRAFSGVAAEFSAGGSCAPNVLRVCHHFIFVLSR
jgi:hypothetical protein